MSEAVVRIASLIRAAQHRPEGYLETVMAAGVVDGDFVRIPRDKYRELVSQFSADDKQPSRRGLGDIVAAGLSAVGITPERVSAALGVKDCGCKKRQQALNALGRRLGIG